MQTGDRQDWRALAKCQALDPNEADALFFPPPGGKSKRAESFCHGCPVMRDCLTFALADGTEGFWAGTTKKERLGMRNFVEATAAPIVETLPNPVKKKRGGLRLITNNVPERSFDLVEGPSFVEELKMLG